MSKPSTDVFSTPKQADSLTRADALEREITDLCAQINAASYRLLQLIAELDDAAPWGAWGPVIPPLIIYIKSRGLRRLQ